MYHIGFFTWNSGGNNEPPQRENEEQESQTKENATDAVTFRERYEGKKENAWPWVS